jgi:hypothetical protein
MKTYINYAIAFLVLVSAPAFSNDYGDAPQSKQRSARKYVKKGKKQRARKALTARQRKVRRARIAARARAAAENRRKVAAARRSAPPRRTTPSVQTPPAPAPRIVQERPAPRPTSRRAVSTVDHRTVGVWRGGAKVTVAKTPDGREAPLEIHGSLSALMETLPEDAEFGARNGIFPGSKAYDPNTRVKGEQRNVRVPCWIHAVRLDSVSDPTERDIQILIGSSSDLSRSRLMLIEIPRARANGPDDPRFERARIEIARLVSAPAAFTGFHKTGARAAVIEGSLFFDGMHVAGTAGAPGPEWAKPATVWEIHPVTSITIEERRVGMLEEGRGKEE